MIWHYQIYMSLICSTYGPAFYSRGALDVSGITLRH